MPAYRKPARLLYDHKVQDLLRPNRRSFLRHTATGIAAPFFVKNLISKPPSDTVHLASFGAGNMAFVTARMLGAHPNVKITHVAEVDSAMLKEIKEPGQYQARFENAKIHEDWRKMLDQEHKNIDAVCVGTPDHMHAPQGMSSLQLGIPVYGQKPLAHDIYEVRRLTETAHKKNLVTQMGIQIHSHAAYKTAVKLVQSGAIGKIKEVHAWSEKKWGDMEPFPDGRKDDVPSTLNWDAWLGVCEPRPFVTDYYHTVNWRKRIDFGTATFGDMGCHIFDPVFGAVALTAPISVRSEGPAPTKQNWAVNTIIHYVFPGTPFTEEKTINIHWYDGDERPPRDVQALVPGTVPGQGSIFIGTKGVMLLPHFRMPTLYPEAQFAGYDMPKIEGDNHYNQFIDAVMGKGKTSAPFEYAGPLTESVLLGPIATRFPKTTLEWNAAKLKFKNSPEATQYVRKQYRGGWKVKGL